MYLYMLQENSNFRFCIIWSIDMRWKSVRQLENLFKQVLNTWQSKFYYAIFFNQNGDLGNGHFDLGVGEERSCYCNGLFQTGTDFYRRQCSNWSVIFQLIWFNNWNYGLRALKWGRGLYIAILLWLGILVERRFWVFFSNCYSYTYV